MLRARPGPVREAWLDRLRGLLPDGMPVTRLPAGIADDALLGGLDLPATLATGRPVAQAGLLARSHGGVVVVPMAERLAPGTAARIAQSLDTGLVEVARDGIATRHPAQVGLVLLDEGRARTRPCRPASPTGWRFTSTSMACRSVPSWSRCRASPLPMRARGIRQSGPSPDGPFPSGPSS